MYVYSLCEARRARGVAMKYVRTDDVESKPVCTCTALVFYQVSHYE